MKTTLIAFAILLSAFAAAAQKKATDREFDGLKGAVKTVLTEYAEIRASDASAIAKNRTKWSLETYDSQGTLLEIQYPTINEKLVFSLIDGFKTFKRFEIKRETKPRNVLKSAPIEEPDPIEPPEKLFPPDNRYNLKYVYEYDTLGRVVSEREYLNNGKLNRLTTFKYDEKGRVVEENANDAVALTKFAYKYDERGNLIEKSEDRDIKKAGVDSESKTVYSDYKVDARGNWTQRKSTHYFEVYGEQKSSATMYYRTIVYFK